MDTTDINDTTDITDITDIERLAVDKQLLDVTVVEDRQLKRVDVFCRNRQQLTIGLDLGIDARIVPMLL